MDLVLKSRKHPEKKKSPLTLTGQTKALYLLQNQTTAVL